MESENETQLEIVCQNAGPSGPHRNHKSTSSPFIATGKSSPFFGASISQDEEQHSMTRHPESVMVWMNVVTAGESARMIDESARNILPCVRKIIFTMYLGKQSSSPHHVGKRHPVLSTLECRTRHCLYLQSVRKREAADSERKRLAREHWFADELATL